MEYPVAVVKRDFSKIMREVRNGPVIVTKRGEPEAVILAYADYERLRRWQAYERIVQLSAKLKGAGITARELYEESRQELEHRA